MQFFPYLITSAWSSVRYLQVADCSPNRPLLFPLAEYKRELGNFSCHVFSSISNFILKTLKDSLLRYDLNINKTIYLKLMCMCI